MLRRTACVLAAVAIVATVTGSAEGADRGILFGLAQDYPAAFVNSGWGAGTVAAADFNRDGRRDLVVANCGGNGPAVLLNKGNAVFAAPRIVPSDNDACTVGAADFTSDGKPDVIAASYATGNVTLLRGRGDGTFTKGWQQRSGNTPMQFAIADFNSDGHRDIASMNNEPGSVTMFLGDGSGGFRSLGERPVSGMPISLVAGDFNADGTPDLAVTDVLLDHLGLLPGQLQVILGKGDGTFGPRATYPVGGSPEYVDTGDIDHDGRLDLVVANAIYNNDLSILYGKGGGKFEPEQRIAAPGMGRVRIAGGATDGDPGLQLADLNRDGHLDIAVIQTGESKVILLQGDGRRHFSPAGEYPTAFTPEGFIVTT